MLTDAEARAAVATLPWVAHSPKLWPRRCDAIRVAGRAAYAHASIYERPEIRQQHRCRLGANWVFIGLDGRISVYCWSHLWRDGLSGTQAEHDRFMAAAGKWDLDNLRPDLDPEDAETTG